MMPTPPDALHCLEPAAYPLLAPLLHEHAAARAEVPLNAVLRGGARGGVWVDDPLRPRAALISATGSSSYLLGDARLPGLDARLAVSIETQLREDCEAIGGSCFVATLFDMDWEWTLLRAIAHRGPEADQWQYHRFDATRFELWRPGYRLLAPGLTLARIDRALAERLWEGELDEFWPSVEAFLAQGFGYVVQAADGQLLSHCFSCYVSGTRHEIAVRTHDEGFYKRGLATQACAAYLQEAWRRGLEPQWTAMVSHPASLALALKLGFAPDYRLRSWEFCYPGLAD
ncbi:GNAT family N-acetyltransferase [Roseateles sp. DAIF2]|uniref:GNAT family N-acetyltransferase n=1 Tax=Roseateles sp. DAIF2 TaxID=2714952 RepID=UPI0018A26D34|nr:GNAT family N-acetyltransferase [Roseateles sp. DAIF2]QPF76221.1 GNAT family N-acetyltransferase [Roseateles sp. DAIF2]